VAYHAGAVLQKRFESAKRGADLVRRAARNSLAKRRYEMCRYDNSRYDKSHSTKES
jgi:hypothetical protein